MKDGSLELLVGLTRHAHPGLDLHLNVSVHCKSCTKVLVRSHDLQRQDVGVRGCHNAGCSTSVKERCPAGIGTGSSVHDDCLRFSLLEVHGHAMRIERGMKQGSGLLDQGDHETRLLNGQRDCQIVYP